MAGIENKSQPSEIMGTPDSNIDMNVSDGSPITNDHLSKLCAKVNSQTSVYTQATRFHEIVAVSIFNVKNKKKLKSSFKYIGKVTIQYAELEKVWISMGLGKQQLNEFFSVGEFYGGTVNWPRFCGLVCGCLTSVRQR